MPAHHRNQRQDHHREMDLHHPDQHRPLCIHDPKWLVDEAQVHQRGVQYAAPAEDHEPCIDAHDPARQKRRDRKDEDKPLGPAATDEEEIGNWVAEDKAKHRGAERKAERALESDPVEGIGQRCREIIQRKCCFLGQVCGLAKMHLVCVHAAFRVSALPKYAMSGVRLSRAV